jgi:hypothetical protein
MKKLIYSLFLFTFIQNIYADSIPIKTNQWKIYFGYDQIGAGNAHYFYRENDGMFTENGFIKSKFFKLGIERRIEKYFSVSLDFSLGLNRVVQSTRMVYNSEYNTWLELGNYENKLVSYSTFATKFHPLKFLNKDKLKLDIYFTQRLVSFFFQGRGNGFDLERNFILNPRLAYHFGSGISYDFKPKWGVFVEVYYLTTKKHTPETPYNLGIHYKF